MHINISLLIEHEAYARLTYLEPDPLENKKDSHKLMKTDFSL